ncbi:AMP-binding protein [Arthrobacter sp. A5]|uniref:AMP-binding protein n=1 Tax=Arthrobacter sp. A5 TaxID=576926 RepID=UPI003DAA23A3
MGFKYPQKTAVVDASVHFSYAALWQQARSYAAQLKDAGLAPGDVAGIMSPNVVEFPRA